MCNTNNKISGEIKKTYVTNTLHIICPICHVMSNFKVKSRMCGCEFKIGRSSPISRMNLSKVEHEVENNIFFLENQTFLHTLIYNLINLYIIKKFHMHLTF